MKTLILILSFVLTGLLSYSQITPVKKVRVANATTAFGESLSVANEVTNVATNEVWLCITATYKDSTLTTAATHFTLNNGTGVTNLSEGTTTNTTVDVNSNTGNNATLAAASTTRAGVMTKAKFDEVVANNAKVTNATHTGDVTGATELTIGANKVLDSHINWGTAATQVSAADIVIADAGSKITATEVEGALQENRTAIDLNTAKETNVSTALSTGTVNTTTYGITSDGGADDVIIASATNAAAGVATAAQITKLEGISTGSQVNWTLFTQKFVEDDGTPTAHSLTYTAQTAGAVVSLNGNVLDPANYTLTSTTITMGIPVLQYDVVTIIYNY